MLKLTLKANQKIWLELEPADKGKMVVWKHGPDLFQGTPSKMRWFPVVVVVILYISSCGSLEIMNDTEDPKKSHIWELQWKIQKEKTGTLD